MIKSLFLSALLFSTSAPLAYPQNGGAAPSGGGHRLPLSEGARQKVELAYYAVLDVEELEPPEIFLPERLDARRAIREAEVASDGSKGAQAIVANLEIVLLKKEACRSVNSSADLDSCRAGEENEIKIVQAELGLGPFAPALK